MSQEELFTSVKHMPNLGDQISVMPAIKKYWEVTGRRVRFMQMVGHPASYYAGATHPTTKDGVMVSMNDKMFEMMKPLMESQPYIHSYVKYEGQKVDLDFDTIRGKTFVGMPNLMLQSWIMYAFPDLACDLSKPWIELPELEDHSIKEQVEGKIIINFTERYRNASSVLDYYFLKNYAPDIVFAGTEGEHFKFCNQWGLTVPRLEVSDFLEYAYALKYSRFFLGTQSFGWNICQAIHHPRIVELCSYAPNIQPMIGEDSYGFFHQVGVEYYFRLLYNKTKTPNK